VYKTVDISGNASTALRPGVSTTLGSFTIPADFSVSHNSMAMTNPLFITPRMSLHYFDSPGFGYKIQVGVWLHGATDDVNGVRWLVATAGGSQFATPDTTTWTELVINPWSLSPGQVYDVIAFSTYLGTMNVTGLKWELTYTYQTT